MLNRFAKVNRGKQCFWVEIEARSTHESDFFGMWNAEVWSTFTAFFFTQTALTVYHCTRLMGLVETDVSTGGNSPSTSSIPGHEWYNDAVSLASSGAGDWLVTSCIAGRSHYQTFDTPRHSQLAASWAWHDSNYLLKYTASSQHPSNR